MQAGESQEHPEEKQEKPIGEGKILAFIHSRPIMRLLGKNKKYLWLIYPVLLFIFVVKLIAVIGLLRYAGILPATSEQSKVGRAVVETDFSEAIKRASLRIQTLENDLEEARKGLREQKKEISRRDKKLDVLQRKVESLLTFRNADGPPASSVFPEGCQFVSREDLFRKYNLVGVLKRTLAEMPESNIDKFKVRKLPEGLAQSYMTAQNYGVDLNDDGEMEYFVDWQSCRTHAFSVFQKKAGKWDDLGRLQGPPLWAVGPSRTGGYQNIYMAVEDWSYVDYTWNGEYYSSSRLIPGKRMLGGEISEKSIMSQIISNGILCDADFDGTKELFFTFKSRNCTDIETYVIEESGEPTIIASIGEEDVSCDSLHIIPCDADCDGRIELLVSALLDKEKKNTFRFFLYRFENGRLVDLWW